MAGEYLGDPDTASTKYEPACAFVKPATDVVLIGHAQARDSSTTQMQVGVQVGPVQKVVTVVGDRVLYRQGGATKVTPPKPIGEIPLIYERAFGGWDRRNPDPQLHRFEPRNPVGTGFRDPTVKADDEVRLPNLEDPQRPFRAFRGHPAPGRLRLHRAELAAEGCVRGDVRHGLGQGAQAPSPQGFRPAVLQRGLAGIDHAGPSQG